MRILFVNDDGYDSSGLHAVADLFKQEHEIAVVAPDVQKSGYSHSVTLNPEALKYRKVDGYGYDVYAVSGTPVDCVKLGLCVFFRNPDIVVSGVNSGFNLGTDILYSGTVSAASDAASLGYRAFALSAKSEESATGCANFFKKNFELFVSVPLNRGTCLNINYPLTEPRGVKVVRMSILDTFKDAYEMSESIYTPNGRRSFSGLDEDTDEYLCRNGYITVTPITTDRTDRDILKKIKKDKFKI